MTEESPSKRAKTEVTKAVADVPAEQLAFLCDGESENLPAPPGCLSLLSSICFHRRRFLFPPTLHPHARPIARSLWAQVMVAGLAVMFGMAGTYEALAMDIYH